MQSIDKKTLEKEYSERYQELQNKQTIYQKLGTEINDLVGGIRELERLMGNYFTKDKEGKEKSETFVDFEEHQKRNGGPAPKKKVEHPKEEEEEPEDEEDKEEPEDEEDEPEDRKGKPKRKWAE